MRKSKNIPEKKQKTNSFLESRWKENSVKTHQEHLELYSGKSFKYAFVGDSMMRRWLTTAKETWDECFESNSCNLGVGGDGVRNLLFRLRGGAKEKDGTGDMLPGIFDNIVITDTIFLMISTNDCDTLKSEPLSEAVVEIIKKIRSKLPQVKIVLFGIPYRKDVDQFKINMINAKLEQLFPKGNDVNVIYVSLSSAFDVENDYVDHVHLNQHGYQKWFAILKQYVTF